ncbi:hypothetical protein C1N83_27965 (plasmid) [Priestia aryabhattai]
MVLKFLFWNVNNKNLTDLIVELVNEEAIDIVLLAESKEIDDIILERKLVSVTKKPYKSRYISGQKILLLDNLKNHIARLNEDKRTSSCQYLINNQDILVVGVHLRDQYSVHSEDLYDLAGQHRELIDKQQVDKVIVIGDFNMNPYEKGIMGATGFNAIMSREEIRYNPFRTFGYKQSKFYYNPSWDAYSLSSPNGTYHYNSNTKALNPYWHLLDQVIISADLMDCYVEKSFNIVTKIKSTELLKKITSRSTKLENCIPDKENYSDHLPIIFEMNI